MNYQMLQQALGGQLGGAAMPGAQKPFVEIKAGMVNKSDREGGAKLFLSADKRRGMLQLIRDQEGMMHLQWKDRRTNAVGFDLSVFPDEWDYALVKQCDGPRIIRMRFKQGVVSKDHFFWIQEVSDEKDEETCEKLNEFVNNPQAAAAAAAGGEGDAGADGMAGGPDPQFLQQLIPGFGGLGGASGGDAGSRPASSASAGSAASAASSARPASSSGQRPASSGTPALSAEQVQAAMAGLLAPQVDFSDILNAETLLPLLESEDVRSQLAPHLPEGTEPTAEAMAELLRSPQFAQTTQNLTQMMASGAGGDVMQQFGISGVQGPQTAETFSRLLQQAMGSTEASGDAGGDDTEMTEEELAQAIAMSMDTGGADEDQPMTSEDELARAIAMSIAEAEEEDSDQAQDGADSNQP